MLQFNITRSTFAKASKYVFLISTNNQTKRTDVCHAWTSSPSFEDAIEFQDKQEDQLYKVKACQATIDRKLKIIGSCVVKRELFRDGTQVFDEEMTLEQSVQGRDIAVGRIHLLVLRKQLANRNDNQPQQLSKSNFISKDKLQKSKVSVNPIQKLQKGAKSLQVSAVNSLTNSAVNFNSARVPHIQPFQGLNPNNQSLKKSLFNNKQSQVSQNNNSLIQNPINQQQQQQLQIDSDLQLKSQKCNQEELQNDCSLRVFVHFGSNFYLNSSFSVQVNWSDKYAQTHYVNDKIQPLWAQSLSLLGNSQQYLTINVLDQNKNILESTKLSLKHIRKLYPYHIKLVFRQEYFSQRPVVYFSFMREDLPKFSILEKQIKLVVNYDAENISNQYLMIQGKNQLQMPKFVEIDLKKYSSFQQVNRYIEKSEAGDADWKYLMPLETGKRSLVLFKSQLNKNLTLFLLSIKSWVQVYSSLQNSAKKSNPWQILQKKQNFQDTLKQIYYHQQVYKIGKSTEIYNESVLASDNINDDNLWRTITKNYLLRNNLLNTSITNVSQLRNLISSKGQQLTKLKRILLEVKQVNSQLKDKEKSTLVDMRRKQRLSAQNFKITEIEMMLYEKQAELQFKKKRNQEMSHRMSSLKTIDQDTTQLDQAIVKNSTLLLSQQQKLTLLKKIKKQLPRQRQIILKLQQLFQQKQLDNRMNQLLKQQQQKLKEIRISKRQELEKVYNLIKDKNAKENSLVARVKKAEQDLIRLNEIYAKLTRL